MTLHKQPLPRRLAAWAFILTVAGLMTFALLGLSGTSWARALAPFGITSHDPLAHEVGVPLTATIHATFDDDVNTSTVTSGTFVVHGNLGGLVTGTFGYDGGSRTGTQHPAREFHAGEVLRVSASNGISSTGGAALAPYGWQFTAGPVLERRFATFADIDAGLWNVAFSSVAWGDYDNDGDLDVLLTGLDSVGSQVSKVYRNNGPSAWPAFSHVSAGLTGVERGSVAWGDYDNDGDLDILLSGASGTFPYWVSKVYRNDGGGAFTDISAGLTGVVDGSVAWGDYDNDGDLDILLTGAESGTVPRSEVYRNDGAGTFTDINAALAGVRDSSVAWGDHDNDGDLDILLTGDSGGNSPFTKLYRNDGGGTFTPISPGLADVYGGSAAWGDYDNDGDLDILLTGYDSVARVSRVYRNDGPFTFTDIGAGLAGVATGSAAWGDYDNDGDLDILLTGRDGTLTLRSIVYRNDGSATFTDIGTVVIGVGSGSAAWGDVDNDGDLDILLTGDTAPSPVAMVYRNKSRPELGAVAPSSGSGSVGVTTYFTTTWSDPDGSGDLKQLYFHIGASPSLAGNVTLLYNALKNKLWLLDDAGTAWLGGCQPGDVAVVSNSQAELDCSQTAVGGGEDTLGVRWAIEFQAGFEGTKKLGLKCKDRDKARAKSAWKGTWTIE